MNDKNYQQNEERIIAYLTGELLDSEKNDFERQISQDKELQQEIEKWREVLITAETWVKSEPPGIEKARKLQLPIKESAPHEKPIFKYAWQGIAAAIIFTIGYFLGGYNITEKVISQKIPAPQTQEGKELHQVTQTAQEPEQKTFRTIEENGKIILETSLEGSSGRALWVVDTSLEIPEINKGEKS